MRKMEGIKVHELKCWPEYFEELAARNKMFELRKNDRDFKVGETLLIKEWNPKTESYTGRFGRFVITYVLKDAEQFGLMEGFAILGIA